MRIDINSPEARRRLREDWKTVTFKAYHEGAKSVADKVCQKETSSSSVNVYDLLVQLPRMERFKDRIKTQGTARVQHRIANAEFAATVEVKQADIERGEVPQYNNKFEMLGIAARRRPDRFLAELMVSGFTATDYTGTTFFNNAKPHLPDVIDSPTFDNLMTEKPSAASYEKAKQLLMNITDVNGEPMGLGERKMIVCSPKYESTFKQILNATLIAQAVGDAGVAVTNIYQGDAELVVFNWLNGVAREDKWFLLDVSYPLRAFIDQVETQPQFLAADDPNTHTNAFEEHIFRYQVYQRGEMGFGLPQLAIGSTGADAAL